MAKNFTDILKQSSEPLWSDAVNHRFVTELGNGSLPDAVMGAYLVQDHRFLDSFLMLLGAAIATADTFTARIRFSQFAGMISGEENTYFLRAFDALGIPPEQRETVPDTPPTDGFKKLMQEAAGTRSYAAALAVLNVAEWLYLEWAKTIPRPLSENFVHAEWVTLHDNPDFSSFVAFLRAELDRIGPAEEAISRDFFQRAVELEVAFFDAAFSI
ncbi:TenA family protein [Falsirhodobacter sp. alg1]|uniref:TenA family protein n=1 Tax=Falsirhodobacter sp. alg1 TaxID=1472418 RepID=UPI0005ED5568|nr:TenA family protein [Falsirhodobacter sp. alg1]